MLTIRLGSSGPDVAKWQTSIGVSPADGSFGPQTESATVTWQADHGLTADGVVGPATWAKIGASSPAAKPIGSVSIAHVKGLETLSAANLRALVNAASWIGIDPNWLATAISFETGGTFSPSTVNKAGSGATGLIQFMPDTAVRLGVISADPTSTKKERSISALSAMSFVQQLELVKKYFEPNRGKLHSLEDTYLAIFYPKEIGRDPSDVIAHVGDAVYTQNAGFDHDGKGYITRSDVTSAIVGQLNRAIASADPITVAMGAGIGIAGVLAIGATGYVGYTIWKQRKAV